MHVSINTYVWQLSKSPVVLHHYILSCNSKTHFVIVKNRGPQFTYMYMGCRLLALIVYLQWALMYCSLVAF